MSTYTWTNFILAAGRCPATPEQLHAWCEQTGGTLEDAVALARVGLFADDGGA
jgi:hypothetical protein